MKANLFKKGVSVSSGDLPLSTGLGLYFCYQVLHAHQGKIEVHNIPGKQTQVEGVQFKLSIPAPQSEFFLAPQWTPSQRQTLAPWIQQLKTLEVYQISELRPILEKLIQINDPEIQHWLKDLNTSIKEVNETNYRKLVE